MLSFYTAAKCKVVSFPPRVSLAASLDGTAEAGRTENLTGKCLSEGDCTLHILKNKQAKPVHLRHAFSLLLV